MNRLTTTTAALLMLSTAPAAAESLQDRIVGQLAEQGFTRIEISRTLLGRVRVVATDDDTRRELVINPATGLILRDYWQALDREEDEDDRRLRIPRLDDDDDEDDDDEGDDEDDDEDDEDDDEDDDGEDDDEEDDD